MTVVEAFDTNNYEWVEIEAFNADRRFAKIRRLTYQVIFDGNKSYCGTIMLDVIGSDNFDKEVENGQKRDVLDLEFEIVVNYKEKKERSIQVKRLKGVQINGREQSRWHKTYSILFLGTEPKQ